MHFAESQADKFDTEMRARDEVSTTGANSMPGSLAAIESSVVANPMNDSALSRGGAVGGADSVADTSTQQPVAQGEESGDIDDLSKLTKEEMIAIALPIFKESNLCVVASLLPVLITSTIFLTLVFLDMAWDRAPIAECIWIPCVMSAVPGLFYVLLHRQWFTSLFIALFAMNNEGQTSSQAQPAVHLSDSTTVASQEQPRHVENESDTHYSVSDSGDLSFANCFAGTRA